MEQKETTTQEIMDEFQDLEDELEVENVDFSKEEQVDTSDDVYNQVAKHYQSDSAVSSFLNAMTHYSMFTPEEEKKYSKYI